jgi:uncharacterized protein (DUF1015 family)
MDYFRHVDDDDFRLYKVVEEDCVLELTVDSDDQCTLTIETPENYTRVQYIPAVALFELLDKMHTGDYEIGAAETLREH